MKLTLILDRIEVVKTRHWLISIGLIVFSNQWVAGAAAALLGAIIISPNLFADLFKNLKSEPKETTEGNQDV